MVFVTPGMLCSSPFSRVLHSSLIPLPALHAHIPSPLLYFSPIKTLSFSCFFYTKLMLTTKVSVFIFLQKIYYVLVNNQKEHFRVLVNFDLFLMPYNCTILDYRGHQESLTYLISFNGAKAKQMIHHYSLQHLYFYYYDYFLIIFCFYIKAEKINVFVIQILISHIRIDSLYM